ncbi:MAG: hypothetical protein QGI83_05830 [Candidatus Latescibacteria bacterium]|jgi:hypothetical protein|nr:hypothetical protein [Candidatus Latescibacterota bacterium]
MTIDIAQYQGIGQFGHAYEYMLANDSHAPGSVDRVLTEKMVRLCPETAEYLYSGYTSISLAYVVKDRPELEGQARDLVAGCRTADEKIEMIVAFTSGLARAVEDESLEEMRIGGLEEEVIARGSDWCTDVARVASVLCQLAALPSRMVMLFDLGNAYSGHEIVEAYRDGVWGAVDSSTATVYRHGDGTPASTWDLMRSPELIESYRRLDGRLPAYTRPEQFRSAAVSNYFVWDWRDYDYAVSGVDEYYRSILTMSEKGWPGGLRWLHGEDAV